MRYLFLITILFLVSCSHFKKLRPEAVEQKSAPELLSNEEVRLEGITDTIDNNVNLIGVATKLLNETATKTEGQVKEDIKLSAFSIDQAIGRIGKANQLTKDKVRPALKDARKDAMKTEAELKEAEENKALRDSLNKVILFSLLGMCIAGILSFKLPSPPGVFGAKEIASIFGWIFAATLAACSCYQWFLDNHWIAGIFFAVIVIGGLITVWIKYKQEIIDAFDGDDND